MRSPRPKSGRIDFAGRDRGTGVDLEIFTMNPNGTDIRSLTDNAVDDAAPA